jgi:hypothetical protein
MASIPDPYKKHFLDLYKKYRKAKKRKHSELWLTAARCKDYLRQLGDPEQPVNTFREIFGEPMTEAEAAESFRQLCEDSETS